MATATGAWGETYEVKEPVAETPIAETTETSGQVTPEVTPTEVTATEQPAAEATTAETIAEPVVEAPAAIVEPEKPEVKEIIKEVEKIVEKYPEMDEHTKEVFEALMAGEEDKLLSYLSEKNRDYSKMSDYDVVKASFKKQNPNWSSEDIDLKLEVQYGETSKIDLDEIDKDLEPEKYLQAEAHNKSVERNLKLLKLDAVEARQVLEAAKKEIKLPKIEKAAVVPVESGPTAEELAALRNAWVSEVDNNIKELKEFTFKAGNNDIGFEDVTYHVSDAERNEISTFLKDVDMNKMLARLGWRDETGKQDIQKMAGDVLKLEKLNTLLSSTYTQGFTAGTKGTVAEIKNIDLTNTAQTSVASTTPDIGAHVWGHINPK